MKIFILDGDFNSNFNNCNPSTEYIFLNDDYSGGQDPRTFANRCDNNKKLLIIK